MMRMINLQVRVGDEIHVSSHINAVPYLALAMEQVINKIRHLLS